MTGNTRKQINMVSKSRGRKIFENIFEKLKLLRKPIEKIVNQKPQVNKIKDNNIYPLKVTN